MEQLGITVGSYPLEKHILVRVIVMTVCCLTMLGSVFVVLSYLCFKSLRSQARQILLNLSLMDFGIGLANFTGAAVNFDKYYDTAVNGSAVPETIDYSCKAQAFFALLTTFSSVFWTMSLSIYMYTLVFYNYQRSVALFLPLCYLICYGVPIGLTVWLLLTGRLGNAPFNSSGWCGIILVSPLDHSVDVLAGVLGYDLWIYLAFLLCTTIYLSLFLRINFEFKSAAQLVGAARFWRHALQFLDFKLVLIPIAFFLLRIWSCLVNILFVYCGSNPESLPNSLNHALIILAGIGDSGQGLANGLIFVIFVKQVRTKLFSWRCSSCKKTRGKNNRYIGEGTPLMINGQRDSIFQTPAPKNDVLFTPTNSLLSS